MLRLFKLINSSLFLVCLVMLLSLSVLAQDTIRKPMRKSPVVAKSYESAYDRRTIMLDSLGYMVEMLNLRQDSLFRVIRNQQGEMNSLQEDRDNLAKEKAKLELELSDLRGDNLQSSHTTSVLFIFNLVVGIFLLTALIWMYMRRKGGGDSPGRVAQRESGSGGDFDHKLDQIQKLGNLRDRGLLTDDEFNFQKRQILGE